MSEEPRPFGAPPSVTSYCRTHPQQEAQITCRRCGSYACIACTFAQQPEEGSTTGICTACAARGLEAPVQWEHNRNEGLWGAFRSTSRTILAQPTRFFATPSAVGVMPPVMYGVLAYTYGNILFGLTIALLIGGLVGSLGAIASEPLLLFGGLAYGLCIAVSIGVQSPFYGFLGVVMAGGISHGTLWMLGLRGARFEDTLRAVSYSNAPLCWLWVPFLGLLTYPWMIWIETIALRETHQISLDKALLATLGYRVLFFVLFIAMYAGIFALGFWLEQAPSV